MAVLATDDFNRANNADVGTNWTAVESTFKIVSNEATPSNLGTDAVEMYDGGVTWPNNQYAQVVCKGVGAGGGGGVGIGVALRASAGPNYYRIIADVGAATNSIEVAKSVVGAHTRLGALFNVAFAAGDVLKATVVGTTIEVFKNGASIGTRTDAAHASGKPGVSYSSVMGSGSLDAWEGGSIDTYQPRNSAINFQNPAVLMQADRWQRTRSRIFVPRKPRLAFA